MIPYTVIIRFYNGYDKLDRVLHTWRSQTFKPTTLLFVDNGSDIPLDLSSERDCKVIRTERTDSIARSTNIGVENCETECFILANDDTLVNIGYVREMFEISNPNTMVFPIARFEIPSNSEIAPWGKIGDVRYDKDNWKFTHPHHAFEYYSTFQTPTPHDGALHFKQSWLWCNEALDGYGFQDSEYYFRWVIMQRRVFRTTGAVMFHLAHDDLLTRQESPARQKNWELFMNLLNSYKQTGKLPMLTSTNRVYFP